MKITIDIPDNYIQLAIAGARIAYWGRKRSGHSVLVYVHENEALTEQCLTSANFAKALARMAVDHGERFGRIASNMSDSEDGDILREQVYPGRAMFRELSTPLGCLEQSRPRNVITWIGLHVVEMVKPMSDPDLFKAENTMERVTIGSDDREALTYLQELRREMRRRDRGDGGTSI